MLEIRRIEKSNKHLQALMKVHYSQPRGFVGRQIFYEIVFNGVVYGCIAFGSATRFLPGREIIKSLGNGVNNLFYHMEKVNGKYPTRNFTTLALLAAEKVVEVDYARVYGYSVTWFEALVEVPREGTLYKKAGYKLVGETIGYTCKRTGGYGTDAYSGMRVWDTENLRPKRVFYKKVANPLPVPPGSDPDRLVRLFGGSR